MSGLGCLKLVVWTQEAIHMNVHICIQLIISRCLEHIQLQLPVITWREFHIKYWSKCAIIVWIDHYILSIADGKQHVAIYYIAIQLWFSSIIIELAEIYVILNQPSAVSVMYKPTGPLVITIIAIIIMTQLTNHHVIQCYRT